MSSAACMVDGRFGRSRLTFRLASALGLDADLVSFTCVASAKTKGALFYLSSRCAALSFALERLTS